MFRKSLNRAVLELRVTTRTPLLIRAGDSGLDPVAPDLACVRTRHAELGSTVYIPGSSFRGVVRSSAESFVRGRKWAGVNGACDPLAHGKSCGGIVGRKKLSTAEICRSHCLACRLFGSTVVKARAAVRDQFPWDPNANGATRRDQCAVANETEMRHGVAINRLSGSVQHGPFEQEMISAGVEFYGDIALENFQAWQLGLLAAGLDEIEEGFAQLGSSKSRGLGAASVEVTRIRYEQTRGISFEHPAGVALLDPDAKSEYGLLDDHVLPTDAKRERRGLSWRWSIEGEAARRWLEVGREALGGLA